MNIQEDQEAVVVIAIIIISFRVTGDCQPRGC